MKYLGGKFRISRPLSEYLLGRLGGREFVEPFCGALNITVRMPGRRVATDASPYLMSLYRAVRAGWDPPSFVSEETYAAVKRVRDPRDPMTAFVGYGCSFGGKFFGGYARAGNGSTRGYANESRNSLLRKLAACRDVVFARRDYRTLNPNRNFFVYCDPPYAGTTGYAAVGAFDNAEFWETARRWTQRGAIVLVSEYNAPPDFVTVWSRETKTVLAQQAASRVVRIEKLFEWAGSGDLSRANRSHSSREMRGCVSRSSTTRM